MFNRMALAATRPSVSPHVHAVAWAIALATLALSLTACGPANLDAYVRSADRPYGAACTTKAAAQKKRVDDLVYNPVRLRVHKWTRTLPGGRDAELGEDELVAAMVKGEVRNTFVAARGGVGKTTLATAIEAYACGAIPVFMLDLNRDVAARLDKLPQGDNAVLQGCEAQLGIGADAEAATAFRQMLHYDRFVVMLDALDEVRTDVRAKVLAQVEELHKRYPKTAQTVVLARPAIYEPDYGMKGLDSKIEIPALNCSRARSTLGWTAEDDDAKARAEAFIRMFHLDSQSKLRNDCYHPYLATYRDIQVVHRMAKTFNPDTEMGGLQANLTTVHERIVAERLQKELAALKWTQEQVLAAVDGMLRVKGREDGQWNLEFTVARCMETRTKAGGSPEENKYVCEKILQSALFEPIMGAPEWRFGHRTVADLFLARWLDKEIGTAGCEAVDKNAGWLGSKSVVGYLVGQTNGGSCLLELSATMCKAHGFERADVDLMYKGMPMGAARKPLVERAQGKLAEAEKVGKLAPDLLCAKKIIDAL